MENNLDLRLIIVGLIIAGILCWRLVLRSNGKTWRAVDMPSTDLLGKTGIAKSMLRPGGIGYIDGDRLHMMSEGDAIQAGTPVKVIRITGTTVIVKSLNES